MTQGGQPALSASAATTDTQPSDIQALAAKLQEVRGHRVVFLHSAMTVDVVPVLYSCLRRAGHVDDLDLVLSTSGGTIASTRQTAMLLREFTRRLTILVPYRARSAGTLLCLSADELVLGPLAELGPIDSTMDSQVATAPDAPGKISSEDVRAFRGLAEDWFGVTRVEDRLQVLALLATRIFPASLASLYRFDKLVREAAAELLAWQLPGDEREKERESIVARLVGGYHSHDAVICRRDVQELGLRAVDASPEEEEILWALSQRVRPVSAPAVRSLGEPGEAQLVEGVTAIVAAGDFCARHVVSREDPAWAGNGGNAGNAPGTPGRSARALRVRWEISD
jgi:hypothetical protein